MSEPTSPLRIDRLYALLPQEYHRRDAERGYPLKALLRVIAEQTNVVEDDVARLYENWFVETAEDWVVPYIADLVGYRPVFDAGRAGDGATATGRELDRVLVPRREVANTIRYRRRKGTLPLLELLAADVAGWPARAVELFKLLGWNQNVNHRHGDRAKTADLRRVGALALLDGPFDRMTHTVDVRRVDSNRTRGRYNIPSVGVFVWRLRPYSVTRAPAYCAEEAGPHCYTFSALGQDTQLFVRPKPQRDETEIARELNVPTPIRRLAFESHPDRFYGPAGSFAIWADGWDGFDPNEPIPTSALVATDLTDWQYAPPPNHIAVDPELGRIAFPPGQLPKRGVRVTYHYGFSADMGGGEYPRPVLDSQAAPVLYRVGRGPRFELHHVREAIERWREDRPADAVIEIADSRVYAEPLNVALGVDQTLQIRAAVGARPVIRLVDWHAELPDALLVTMDRGSRFTLDGLVVTGRSVHVTGPERRANDGDAPPVCASRLVIRHCTLVPGWAIDPGCRPKRPGEPSLELYNVRASVRVEHSVVGSIQISEDEVALDPIPVEISDSIIDAAGPRREAIGAPGYSVAHATLTIRRSTVFGVVDVHAVELAENCIFNDCVNVARRQIGCVRFCYVSPVCRTPRRYHCQPDLVRREATARVVDPARRAAELAREELRVAPQFTSVRYGTPGYAQLARECADEIRRGADDESELGAFHDLFQPQREASLEERLDEFTPAGMDVGIIFVT